MMKPSRARHSTVVAQVRNLLTDCLAIDVSTDHAVDTFQIDHHTVVRRAVGLHPKFGAKASSLLLIMLGRFAEMPNVHRWESPPYSLFGPCA
jgi:hypothetical protein